MWSARRVSTVMKKTRRGGWGAGDKKELVPASLPRQAARMRREMIRNFEGLSGIASPAEGRCYYRGLPPPHLPVHPPHEPIQPEARHQQHPRDHRRREDPLAMLCEETLQGGGEQPHLHDQEDGDQGQGAVDGGEAPSLR